MSRRNQSMILAYVSGALTNGEDLPRLRRLYENIGLLCQELGMEAYVPHLYTDPEHNADKQPDEVYAIDMKRVSQADILIAYVGLPSLGVGAEIERAHHASTDVLLLREHAATVSRLVRGCPAVIGEVAFSDDDDALVQLRDVLEQWLRSRS